MKVNLNILKALAPKFGVIPASTNLKSAVQHAQKLPAQYEPVVVGGGYEWSDDTNSYVLNDQQVFFLPMQNLIIWIWDKTLLRGFDSVDKLKKWVLGDDKYPDGKGNAFMGIYKEMLGGEIGGGVGVAEPEDVPIHQLEPDPEDMDKGGSDIKFGKTGQHPPGFELKSVDPKVALMAQITKKAGASKRLQPDDVLDFFKKAQKLGIANEPDFRQFLSSFKLMKEGQIKSSTLQEVIRHIVKGVVNEIQNNEMPYDEKWVEDWANKIWPDPTDIRGRGNSRWRLDRSKQAPSGERVYRLSKTQQVTRTRYLVNRGIKWYYLDVKPDHTKKWVEVPASEVPIRKQPKEPGVDEETGTGAVAGFQTPFAFKKKEEAITPLSGMEEEEKLDEETVTGMVDPINVPMWATKKGGSERGVKGSEALGYTLTNQGKNDMKRHADKIYEGKQHVHEMKKIRGRIMKGQYVTEYKCVCGKTQYD